jgi:hypothetical protein
MPQAREVTIVTTRDRVEALQRHLEVGYLGYDKDDGKVRDLLKDADRALQEKA